MIGQALGHYRIEEKLGAGGMGEVFRALDTTLNRDVAIKVLTKTFAHGPERLIRFEREAQVLASLNHSNIAAIYGFENVDGVPFLVLEYVPGRNLAGPLPVEEALSACRQIAEALEAAHAKGVMHRDLKPSNVKVTPEGKVKVLDFGLAKAFAPEASEIDNSPTVSAGPTRAGMILGTPAYMSPEQARGRTLDRRTDIWSFGCVLYEALAGRQAFGGDGSSDAMAAVLRGDPDWKALPAGTPPNIRRLLRRCLEKDPERRLHDIADARIEIDDAESPAQAALPAHRAPWLALAGVLVGAVGIGVGLWSWTRSAAPPQPVKRLVINLPETEPLALGRFAPLSIGRTSIALSPDGARLVYVAVRRGVPQLFVRQLDQFEAKALPGTEGAYAPFFSPDGRSVGFFAQDKLKKVSLEAGEPVILCEARNGISGAWTTDDTILFVDREGGALNRLPVGGGAPKALRSPGTVGSLDLLPGGRAVLTSFRGASFNPDSHAIAVVSVETGEATVVQKGGTNPRYIAGRLVFARGGSLLAAPFDLGRLNVTGPAATVVEGVRTESWGLAQFAVSGDGTLVYVTGGPAWIGKLVWVDRQGKATPLGVPAQNYGAPRLSPDGRRLAIPISGAKDDVWIYEFARGTFLRLTVDGNNAAPAWTPDGKRVAFRSHQDGAVPVVVWKPADGSGAEERLTTSHSRPFGPDSFSPDGKTLAYMDGGDIWLLPLEGDRKPRPFLQSRFGKYGAAFSPDGRWIAHTSDESGRYEVWVRPYPGPGATLQISTDGGEEPVWSRDGREIFYRNGQKWMVVAIETKPEFRAGTPRLMFEGPYFNVPGLSYDVAPDGKRFLMIQVGEEEPAPKQLQVVVNWVEELKRRTGGESSSRGADAAPARSADRNRRPPAGGVRADDQRRLGPCQLLLFSRRSESCRRHRGSPNLPLCACHLPGALGNHSRLEGPAVKYLGPPQGSLYGPGRWNWDMALLKDIPLRESLKLEFRADALDVFNHPQFGQPAATIGTGRSRE